MSDSDHGELNDLRIVLHDPVEERPDRQGLETSPAGGVPVGRPGDGDVRIHMGSELLSGLRDFARTDTARELAGILVGRIVEKEGFSVHIDACIEARYAESVQSSVRFTHRSWEYINQVKDTRYPDSLIVGWFHTHPGFGIFLSSLDTFIHASFFHLPWQIAFVVDPLADQEGFFQWKDGRMERCGGYFLHGAAPSVDEPGDSTPQRRTRGRKPRIGFHGYIIAAQALVIILLASTRVPHAPRPIARDNPPVPVERPTLPRGQVPPSPAIRSQRTHIVVVGKGESLWAVSRRVYGTGRYYALLAVHNRIPDPGKIQEGQVLEAPALPSYSREKGTADD